MDPNELAERRFINICLALSSTQATLRNGMIAADLPGVVRGVQVICNHTRIPEYSWEFGEVAFKLQHARIGERIEHLRLGASLGAALITDRSIGPVLSGLSDDKDFPWERNPAIWKDYLSYILRRAEDFHDLMFDNWGRDTSGPFLENIQINRRKPDTNFYDTKLSLGDTK